MAKNSRLRQKEINKKSCIDERVEAVYFTIDSLIVDLRDGRSISVPLTWYPKLLKATPQKRAHWEVCGGGFGIHWPEIGQPPLPK